MPLAIVLRLGAAASRAQTPVVPGPGQIAEPGTLGLLEVSWLLPDNAGTVLSNHLDGFRDPSAASPRLARLDREGVVSADGRRLCPWVRDYDRLAGSPGGCEFTEADYDTPALHVTAFAAGGWYRINLPAAGIGAVWIHSTSRFHTLIELLAGDEHLNYVLARGPDVRHRLRRR